MLHLITFFDLTLACAQYPQNCVRASSYHNVTMTGCKTILTYIPDKNNKKNAKHSCVRIALIWCQFTKKSMFASGTGFQQNKINSSLFLWLHTVNILISLSSKIDNLMQINKIFRRPNERRIKGHFSNKNRMPSVLLVYEILFKKWKCMIEGQMHLSNWMTLDHYCKWKIF